MDPRLRSMLVRVDSPIRAAMAAIDVGACEIALAVDEEMRLVGTISDGDIRRALLRGEDLDSKVGPCASVAPIIATPRYSRAEVLDIMRARHVAQVPIVDEKGRLIGLHILQELIGGVARSNCALVMCGGKGTRLAPFTQTVPKPMLPVAGRPILERIVLHLVGGGIKRIYLAVNYLAEVIEAHFGDGREFGAEVSYLRERAEVPLGTGGAFGLLKQETDVSAPVIVVNGDLLTQFAISDLLAHHETSAAVATMAVRKHTYEVPYGVVSTTLDGVLADMTEKPIESWLINAGIYVLSPTLCDRVPAGLEYPLTDLLGECVARGERVSLWNLEDEWHDVGRVSDLHRARGEA